MPVEKAFERSAGGVIMEDGRVLLIQMRNLEGVMVWTFPKGHIERDETPQAAALREVAEETGFNCEITGELYKAGYSFVRNGRPVDKEVHWYRMKRVGGDGVVKTPEEIFGLKWCPLKEAGKYLLYPSDLRLLELLSAE
ncbi:MAG: hypothetical protein A2X28_01165 [Elusimicrobia bacterium GWA2_56_46]|nr:MAG: hypothetical protein A2X28_01165 [Elusimicrobia bacterium GWA2_56_46]OGR53982.1 MAG: hypothetical protein A2X39_09805 [Elusimicrobia bacterium GWC2_56_31]